jgi:hypothetical protein
MFWTKFKVMVPVMLATIATLTVHDPTSSQEQVQPAIPYLSKIGDIMGLIQLRHFKLWFAGSAGNWELAAYEARQIDNGFNVAAKARDTAFGQLMRQRGTSPLADVAKAIAVRNKEDFNKGFERLTAACNACHSAAHIDFVRIRIPTSSPFTNQIFPPG